MAPNPLQRRVLRGKNVNTNIHKSIETKPKRTLVENHKRANELTHSNLKQLQKAISAREIAETSCDHFLCSLANMEMVFSSRLWFLFELEMVLPDTQNINLRNSCYYHRIYHELDRTWPASNILWEELPNDYEYFPMEQLYIADLKVKSRHKQNLDDVSVCIKSFIDSELDSVVNKRKIPRSMLHSRNREDIFNDLSIDTKQLLSNILRSSSPHSSSFIEVEPEKPKEVTCSLINKVRTRDGFMIPKLSK